MSTSDIWNLLGLSVATIGAVLLAYDVVYGAGKRFKAEALKTQLANLQKTRNYLQENIKGLPQPPWKRTEIDAQLAAENSKWDPEEQRLVHEVATFYPNYEDRVVTFGAYGVILIVLGFLFQIVGLIFHVLGR
jgi:hypothetical protein